jgi:hypothetical protein
MYGQGDLDGYLSGRAYGQFADGEELTHTLIKSAVGGVTSYALATVEGYQNKGAGGEVKIGGKVPLNIVIAAATHLAGFFDLGDAIGVDSDYLHAAGDGALAVWLTNRGHAMGSEMGKKAAETKAAVKGVPSALRGENRANVWERERQRAA